MGKGSEMTETKELIVGSDIGALFSDPKLKKQVMRAIPRHMDADKLLRVAMTTIRTNSMLLKCTKQSLLACIMGAAQLGLEPEPALGQCYLVPYWNKRKSVYEATLIPGYRGYLSLARRTGEVASVSAQVVYENDRFNLEYGLNERLEHVPADGDRGEVRGAYVVFRYQDKSHSFDYMSKADIDKIRARSQASDKGPWVTDYPEMAKKTVIRRHIKMVPLSVDLARADYAETLAITGEDQAGLFLPDAVGENQQITLTGQTVETFKKFVVERQLDPAAVDRFVKITATRNETSTDAVEMAAQDNPDQFLTGFQLWLDREKEKEMEAKPEPEPEPAYRPTGQPAYNRPPDGVNMDGSEQAQAPQAKALTVADWDPAREPILQRYVAEKAALLKNIATDMGLDVGDKAPRDIHIEIIKRAEGERKAEVAAPVPGESDDRANLIEIAMGVKSANPERWDAIARSHRAPSPNIQNWSTNLINGVIDEFNAIESESRF
jgi:recombination protein RecT